ncbi:PIN domain-containing protein [Williamsia maris]|uniref:PIN domain-containing protein n=1 Tax=Williamsia maris TaxID=72806 RepID=A0ABT1HJM2_9NOCA|nr:PIN domain-containing protein [Williamsia maris]MCP2178123.1 PIN domain-containing protein [Williamsia maris]
MSDDQQYLIDNNVLIKMSTRQRASEFFVSSCHVPSEVLYEARGFPDYEVLLEREYRTTPGVLRQLVSVMATVSVGDTSLVDLFANRGNADPIIVACALDAQHQNEGLLFGPNWVVVSDDDAVRTKADLFGISLKTSAELKAIIEK